MLGHQQLVVMLLCIHAGNTVLHAMVLHQTSLPGCIFTRPITRTPQEEVLVQMQLCWMKAPSTPCSFCVPNKTTEVCINFSNCAAGSVDCVLYTWPSDVVLRFTIDIADVRILMIPFIVVHRAQPEGFRLKRTTVQVTEPH